MSINLSTSAGDACLYLGALFASDGFSDPLAALPGLRRFVARASTHVVPVCDSLSFVNWVAALQGRIPEAAVCRFGDTGKTDAHCWLRADPVNLQPAQDTLRLFAAPPASNAGSDAALMDAVAAHLEHDGWRLELCGPRNWYLRAPGELHCDTTPTERVEGADVLPFMPRGDDAPRLRKLMNDVQMLLHRQAAGTAQSINSIWPWGQGCWRDVPAEPGTAVGPAFSNHSYLQGLWRHWGAACAAPDDAMAAVESSGGFVAMPELAASDAGLATLEQQWLAPTLSALADGRIDSASLVLRNGLCLRLSRRELRRFWRRPKSLNDTLTRLAQAATN